MLEIFIYPYKYRDKSKLVCQRWKSPVVASWVVNVGWALPTFNRLNQRYLVGTAHPTIRIFRSVRV
jgi:hypothetical protein